MASTKKDASAIIAGASRPMKSAPKTTSGISLKRMWCETTWTNLSIQAKNLDMPKEPYFDPETYILDKENNKKLWDQVKRLYEFLGEENAPYATPIMEKGGEVKWLSFLNDDCGKEAEIYDNALDEFMSRPAP